mgnify:FL=1
MRIPRLVTQLGEWACGVACAVSALSISYSDALRQLEKYKGAKVRDRPRGLELDPIIRVMTDLTVPWEQQSQHVSAGLVKWLQYLGEYQAQPHLKSASYVRSTARKKGELRAQIDQLKRDAVGRPSDPEADANQARLHELWKEICTLSNVERGGAGGSIADISNMLQ